MTLNSRPTSLEELNGVAEAMLFGLPMLLNARMPYACVVENIIGRTSGGEFGYEIQRRGVRPYLSSTRSVLKLIFRKRSAISR